jgi:hypothetical protein
MVLFKKDISEYGPPWRAGHARLVVAPEGIDGNSDAHALRTRLHGDMIGQFFEYPDGRSPDAFLLTSRDEATGAKVGTQLFSAHFSTALGRSWGQTVERGQQRRLHITIRSSSAVRTLRRDRSRRNTTRGRALTKAQRTSGFATGLVGGRRTSVPIGKPTEVVEGCCGGAARPKRRDASKSRAPTNADEAPAPEVDSSSTGGRMSRMQDYFGVDFNVVMRAIQLRHTILQQLDVSLVDISNSAREIHTVVKKRLPLHTCDTEAISPEAIPAS